MTRAELLTELRIVITDIVGNLGWETAVLTRYLAEGQDKFCEETGYFRDIANYTLDLSTDTALYAVDDRIIEVLDIWDGSRKLTKEDHGEIIEWTSAEGTPQKWRTDQTTGYIHVWPTPTSDDNGDSYQMHVWRYSVDDFNDDDIEPEIPARMHFAMVEWAAYKAFMHHDEETQDPVKARDHLQAFKNYVSDGQFLMRRRHGIESRVGTTPAYRT